MRDLVSSNQTSKKKKKSGKARSVNPRSRSGRVFPRVVLTWKRHGGSNKKSRGNRWGERELIAPRGT